MADEPIADVVARVRTKGLHGPILDDALTLAREVERLTLQVRYLDAFSDAEVERLTEERGIAGRARLMAEDEVVRLRDGIEALVDVADKHESDDWEEWILGQLRALLAPTTPEKPE